ncbi:uncharacterized protein YjbJ (UPF0337 family) [Variovorax sp. GrIS 2.14]|jgi:uncharacterized protein YjbJ (UPF0337 family)
MRRRHPTGVNFSGHSALHRIAMNKNQAKGALGNKGSAKEASGKVIGSEKLKAEGKAARAVQEKVGDAKDVAKTLTQKT